METVRNAVLPPRHGGFTIIEMIIVITVIVIVLAIAVPGLSAMNAEARQTSAVQTIQGMTSQAYYRALADRTKTAIRFFPAEWDVQDKEGTAGVGRQRLALYSYGLIPQPTMSFVEGFMRTKDVPSVSLPEDVWAAPLEALSADVVTLPPTNGGKGDPFDPFGQEFVLKGSIGRFCFNANGVDNDDPNSGTFLNADDFLLVCDPETGFRTTTPKVWPLRANVPGPLPFEADAIPNSNPRVPYQRYSFSGVVTYRREAFAELGTDATGDKRQEYLRTSGRPYLVHRFGGSLLPGLQRPVQ